MFTLVSGDQESTVNVFCCCFITGICRFVWLTTYYRHGHNPKLLKFTKKQPEIVGLVWYQIKAKNVTQSTMAINTLHPKAAYMSLYFMQAYVSFKAVPFGFCDGHNKGHPARKRCLMSPFDIFEDVMLHYILTNVKRRQCSALSVAATQSSDERTMMTTWHSRPRRWSGCEEFCITTLV